ncbi:MAG TPA: hypothetical protein VMH28_01240 [Candidatus Acidoferrales bacterium]|nr:hypothetical protein [Candidatus Acidoferrales bacterium]
MTTRIHILVQRPNSILRLALPGILATGVTLLAAQSAATNDSVHGHDSHLSAAPAKLVQVVRDATQQFTDVNAATAANYQPLFGCVSGPDQGAMGVHYINLALYGDGAIDSSKPEALIYEPSNGALRLVGVEYIVDAATWLKTHSAPPMLEGQAFQFVNSPNRFGLPAFFELHVWAWRENPMGAFVDWNTRVSCEGQ